MIMTRLLILRILKIAFSKRLFDIPDSRKDHTGAIPRLGGISFVPTLFFTICLAMATMSWFNFETTQSYVHKYLPQIYMLLCGITLLALIGVADDLIGVNYRKKFVAQILSGSLLPLSGLWINNLHGLLGIHILPIWLGIPLTIFLVVFIINSVNLIDGVDGLAAGLCSISCGILGLLFISAGSWLHALLAFTTLGILIPFFYQNVFGQVKHGRKIFMGDTGSLVLGIILSFLIISYSIENPNDILVPGGATILAFSTLLVPMFDVIRVVIYRILHHRPLFQPDRNHIHHKLLDITLKHHTTMIIIILIEGLYYIINITGIKLVNSNIVLLFDIITWITLNIIINKMRRNCLKKKGN